MTTTIQQLLPTARTRSMLKRVALLTAAVTLFLLSLTPPASAVSGWRIVVHTGGLKAGLVEIDVSYAALPGSGNANSPFWDNDTGVFKVPNFCGLRVYGVDNFLWLDSNGATVEAENSVELGAWPNPYYDDYYVGGVVFTGPIASVDLWSVASVGPPSTPVCGQTPEPSWSFPTPLSYGGAGPQFGAQVLVLEGIDGPIEFLDHAGAPIKLDTPWPAVDPPKVDVCTIKEFCEGGDIAIWKKWCNEGFEGCWAPPGLINDIVHRHPADPPALTIREFIRQERTHSHDEGRRTRPGDVRRLPNIETEASFSTGGRRVR